MPALDLGSNRIVYKATNFQAGIAVTAHLWSPALAKSGLQTFTEIEEGLYYLDFAFTSIGAWPMLLYEDGAKAGFAVVRVETVEGTLSLPQATRLLLAALCGNVTGAGTPVVSFRDLADTKNRIVATLDERGNRTVTILDAD